MAVTPNRGYVYPDENTDDWWNVWVALMNAIDADMAAVQPSTLSSDIKIKKANPSVRLRGTESQGADFRLYESAGALVLQRNDGTENAPTWVSLYTFLNNGDVRVETAGKGIILTSPGGIHYRVGIDEDGAPTFTGGV